MNIRPLLFIAVLVGPASRTVGNLQELLYVVNDIYYCAVVVDGEVAIIILIPGRG